MNSALEREFDDGIAYLMIGWELSPDDDEINIHSLGNEFIIGPDASREIFVLTDFSDEKEIRLVYTLLRKISFSFFCGNILSFFVFWDRWSDNSDAILGDIECFDDIPLRILTPGDDPFRESHCTREKEAVHIPRKTSCCSPIRIKQFSQIRNGDDGRAEIKQRYMGMRKINTIEFRPIEIKGEKYL